MTITGLADFLHQLPAALAGRFFRRGEAFCRWCLQRFNRRVIYANMAYLNKIDTLTRSQGTS